MVSANALPGLLYWMYQSPAFSPSIFCASHPIWKLITASNMSLNANIQLPNSHNSSWLFAPKVRSRHPSFPYILIYWTCPSYRPFIKVRTWRQCDGYVSWFRCLNFGIPSSTLVAFSRSTTISSDPSRSRYIHKLLIKVNRYPRHFIVTDTNFSYCHIT